MRENFAVENDYGITDEEYEIVDEPYLGYQVHLNKLSCGVDCQVKLTHFFI